MAAIPDDAVRLDDFRPVLRFHKAWTAEDAQTAPAVIGYSGSQARWEAFAFLLAVDAWVPLLRGSKQTLIVFGDAQGVLDSVAKNRGRDSHINKICGEITLLLAPLGLALETKTHLEFGEQTL